MHMYAGYIAIYITGGYVVATTTVLTQQFLVQACDHVQFAADFIITH